MLIRACDARPVSDVLCDDEQGQRHYHVSINILCLLVKLSTLIHIGLNASLQ